jgi:methionine transaminase
MISPKISGVDYSSLESLSELAKQHNAIDLIGAHPSIGSDDVLLRAIIDEVSAKPTQSVEVFGNINLRQKVAERLKSKFGHPYNAETDITITGGSNQSIFGILTAMIREGDQVIVFEPTASRLIPAIELCGGQPVYIKLKEPGFYIDWEDVQKMITGKTRMILLSSPHNPTGWAMSELDAIRMQRIINGTRIVVVSDESFQHIVFDGEAHQSMAAYPKLAEQSVIVASLSLAYRIPAWPLAYVAAPPEISKEIRKIFHMTSQCVNAPIQEALSKVLDTSDFLTAQTAFYQQKRDLFISEMEESKFKMTPSRATCYQIVGINGLSELNDREFAANLIVDHGVAMAPLSVFNHEKNKNQYLRIDLTQPDDVLVEAAHRLKQL